jgi:hypothetical protein
MGRWHHGPVQTYSTASIAAAPAVTGIRTADDAEWDAAVDACPHATYFHTREWAELWQRYSGGHLRPVARLATFADGATALLPAVEKTVLDLPHVGRLSTGLRTVISAYGSTYGGWVGDGLTAAHHRALRERTRRLNVDLTQNPFDDAVAAAGLPWTRRDFTQVVALPEDPADLRRRWSRGHVSAVNKAARAGLTVTEARTEAQWRDYVRIYRLSLERWADPVVVHREELFLDLARSGSDRVRLWLVERDGAAIAGAICCYQGRSVVYWHGALDVAHQDLRPATFLHAQVMRHAVEAGYRWYDFCPSGGSQGVVTFKERFGAERRDVHSLVADASLKRRLHRVRAAVART